jgi:hypothetical protein
LLKNSPDILVCNNANNQLSKFPIFLLQPNHLPGILPPSPNYIRVTEPPIRLRKELNGTTRSLLALLGCGLIVLLGIAAYLHPDSRHYGTHEQLGLPPCTFFILFGVPCPTCGMTTAWSHLMHGEIGAALRANAGGTLMAIVAILVVPWSLATAFRGRPCPGMPGENARIWIACALFAVILIQWACRLAMHYYGC